MREKRQRKQGGSVRERERERETERQRIPSRFHTVSAEPEAGLKLKA